MNVGQAAAAGLAAGEGDLELPPHVLGIFMAQQMVGQGLRVRRRIEGLTAADAGKRARSHIAYRIAASLPSRNSR